VGFIYLLLDICCADGLLPLSFSFNLDDLSFNDGYCSASCSFENPTLFFDLDFFSSFLLSSFNSNLPYFFILILAGAPSMIFIY